MEQVPKGGESEKPKTTENIAKLKDITRSSDGLGMETDQAEQFDALSNQSAKVLHKNCDIEETDASTTSESDNRFPSPFNN